jgi:chromate transport protein ChrA
MRHICITFVSGVWIVFSLPLARVLTPFLRLKAPGGVEIEAVLPTGVYLVWSATITFFVCNVYSLHWPSTCFAGVFFFFLCNSLYGTLRLLLSLIYTHMLNIASGVFTLYDVADTSCDVISCLCHSSDTFIQLPLIKSSRFVLLTVIAEMMLSLLMP